MRVGLIDVDSHNFPNLPLMKISAYHKGMCDNVEFADHTKTYDRVYVSKVFSESVEPELPECSEILRGGSGYDLENRLPYEIEHQYPDYGLYEDLTKDTAYGFLTRGCPRKNHGFCITPKKDGCKSVKTADLSEFWNGQKRIVLLDQNILAAKERMELLEQLAAAGAVVEFNGGMDARFINEEIIEVLKRIKVKDFHFAWDDPREDLRGRFELIASKLVKPSKVGVYVLTNYWSSMDEDIKRCRQLKEMGFRPFVMVYNKQLYVDQRGRWLPDVAERFTRQQLREFKVCQHMQRWCGSREILMSCDFMEYGPFKRWKEKGMPVPERTGQLRLEF